MFDVVIIGAGLAGLAAAAECEALGKTALVLEASHRVGGRVKTELKNGLAIDWGAEWIIPDLHHEVMKLMQHAGLSQSWETAPLPVQWTIGGQKSLATYASLKQTDQDFADALQSIENDAKHFSVHGSAKTELSIRQYLNTMTSSKTASILEAAIFPLTGGAAEHVSNHMLWHEIIYHNASIDETLNANACRIEQGCDALAKILQNQLKCAIAFRHCVTSITWTENKCEVTCGDRKFESSNLICTVPLPTLQAITFDPPLPADMLATAVHSNAGRVAKVWAHCQSNIQPLETLNDQGALRYGYARQSDENHWLLCGQILIDDKIELTNELAAQLIRSNWPSVEILTLDVTDWTREPYARASWHSSRVGWANKTSVFHHAHGRLHFAGGDIAPKWAGWMEGALLSGKLVAQHVCQS